MEWAGRGWETYKQDIDKAATNARRMLDRHDDLLLASFGTGGFTCFDGQLPRRAYSWNPNL
jgi:hypothetical protein